MISLSRYNNNRIVHFSIERLMRFWSTLYLSFFCSQFNLNYVLYLKGQVFMFFFFFVDILSTQHESHLIKPKWQKLGESFILRRIIIDNQVILVYRNTRLWGKNHKTSFFFLIKLNFYLELDSYLLFYYSLCTLIDKKTCIAFFLLVLMIYN